MGGLKKFAGKRRLRQNGGLPYYIEAFLGMLHGKFGTHHSSNPAPPHHKGGEGLNFFKTDGNGGGGGGGGGLNNFARKRGLGKMGGDL